MELNLVPAGQLVTQAELSDKRRLPISAHTTHADDDVDPTGLAEPEGLGQSTQPLPSPVEYLPAGQDIQFDELVDPVTDPVPAGQYVGPVLPDGQYEPDGHSTALEGDGQYDPAGHVF